MSNWARLATGLAVAVLLAAPAAATTVDDPIEITGEVDGLFPGGEATLGAEVVNPHQFPIIVTSFDVSVGDASPSCPASVLEIGTAASEVTIPPGQTGVVSVPVRMSETAPEACQGAVWPLTHVATAVEVGPGGVDPTPTSPEGPFDDLPLTGAAIGGLLTVAVGLVSAGLLTVRHVRRKTGEPEGSG